MDMKDTIKYRVLHGAESMGQSAKDILSTLCSYRFALRTKKDTIRYRILHGAESTEQRVNILTSLHFAPCSSHFQV